jgi:hypothetical protein
MTLLWIQNTENGVLYNASELVTSVSWDTTLMDQPGKAQIELIDDGHIRINNGAVVRFIYNDAKILYGYVFTIKRSQEKTLSISVYDQLRYLQNKDTYVFKSGTSSERLAKICKDRDLTYKIVHPSTHTLSPIIYDNKSYYEMIKDSLDKTADSTETHFIIRDEYGEIQHLDTSKLMTDLIIGNESLAIGYEFEQSIDSNTYNQIKLVQENKTTMKRDVYIANSNANIKKWGLLQRYETMNEKMNAAQIKARADVMLKIQNRESKSLKLSLLGDVRLKAGNSVILSFSGLGTMVAFNSFAIITSASHKFTHDMHTCDITLEVY